MRLFGLRACWIVICLVLTCVGRLRADDEGIAFFEARIRPVLVQYCYECHSQQASELKGSLSLENSASLIHGGDSGPVIVAGHPEQSLLIDALKYEGLQMPPTGRLPDDVVRDFEKWITLGAPDPRTGDAPSARTSGPVDLEAGRQFWAFQPPARTQLPVVKQQDWPANSIDVYILAGLEAEGIAPSPPVDSARLLRRVTYDLTGLPPSESEILSFVSNSDPLHETRVIDQLLSSRAFAEHWGRHWLDVARYADSNGGDFNATFHEGWRYRNYVIDSYASDLPYDQFVREQLAGDLLPATSEEESARQLIATGFLAIGPKMLSERDKLKLRMDVIDEQVDTVGKAFLGMTLGCARCHDHKFDPIPTTDYYALAGIFDSTDSLDGEIQQYVSNYVRRPLPIEPAHAAALASYDAEKKSLTDQLAAAKDLLKKSEAELKSARSMERSIVVDDTQAEKVGEWKESTHTKPFVGAGYLHDDNRGKGEKRVRFRPIITQAGVYDIRVSYTASNGRATNTPVSIHHASGMTDVHIDQTRLPAGDGLYTSVGKFHLAPSGSTLIEIATSGTDGHVIVDAVACVSLEPEVPVAPIDIAPLELAIRTGRDRIAEIEKKIKDLDSHAPPPAPMAIGIREGAKMVDCQICVRGEPKQRGPAVPRGFLQVVHIDGALLPTPQSSGRRELAAWMADARHPLTARVYVNRVWQKLFGEGLVRSVDNFGQLGDRPTHPELLDHLTLEFIEHGWSTKWLVREIVLSHTYRQDSVDRPDALAVDPENRWLWRANCKRLTAEQLRDSLLTISGEMQPSVADSPVQGLGKLVDDNQANSKGYQGSDAPVRSIYLPVIRNEVSTLLTVFDFADPDFVVGRRETTTVPAQALTMLNHPFVIQSAEATTERMLREASPSDDQRLEWAAIALWGRPPEESERRQVRDFLNQWAPDPTATDAQRKKWSQTIQAMFASSQFQFLD